MYKYNFSHVCCTQPKSVGHLTLASADPFESPLIDPNYFAEQEDIEDYVKAVKHTRDLMDQPALQEYSGVERAPGDK